MCFFRLFYRLLELEMYLINVYINKAFFIKMSLSLNHFITLEAIEHFFI